MGPKFAKAMLERYRLEPKFGWGHAQFKRDLADKIEKINGVEAAFNVLIQLLAS
jgi:hypothetical protein